MYENYLEFFKDTIFSSMNNFIFSKITLSCCVIESMSQYPFITVSNLCLKCCISSCGSPPTDMGIEVID